MKLILYREDLIASAMDKPIEDITLTDFRRHVDMHTMACAQVIIFEDRWHNIKVLKNK